MVCGGGGIPTGAEKIVGGNSLRRKLWKSGGGSIPTGKQKHGGGMKMCKKQIKMSIDAGRRMLASTPVNNYGKIAQKIIHLTQFIVNYLVDTCVQIRYDI